MFEKLIAIVSHASIWDEIQAPAVAWLDGKPLERTAGMLSALMRQ
jgi:hypothetical protein